MQRALKSLWGNQYDAKRETLGRILSGLQSRHPDLLDILDRTGLTNSARLMHAAVEAAERKGKL